MSIGDGDQNIIYEACFDRRSQIIDFKHKFKEIFQTQNNIAKILTKKPIYPTEREIAENSRSRSAKLRILQKVDPNTQGGVFGKKNKKKEKYSS